MANLLSKFLGRTASEGAAFAMGLASGPVLEPAVEAIRQEAWNLHADRVIEAMVLAEGVSTGQIGHDEAAAQAKRQGFDGDHFDQMVRIADTGPGVASALQLWRRGLLNEAGFRRALKREGLEAEWIDALAGLHDVILSPSEAANAWQQGFMTEARASAEAELSGVSPERSLVQRELAGDPPGAMDGLELLRRGIIDEPTYRQLVREGRLKTKYTDAVLALRSRILSATDAANLWLRGWMTEGEAKRIGAENGYDGEAMDWLYKNRGRPATVRQAHIGFMRGGRLPGATTLEETLQRSIAESNIRVEWSDILQAGKYTMPSAFVVRSLTEAGTFSGAVAEEILVQSGWRPDLAKLAADDWSKTKAGGAAHKWADRARGNLYTRTHTEFLDESIDEARARTNLGLLGATDAEITAIIPLWEAEREIRRTELTPAQIKKAWKAALYDTPTALAELVERGYTSEDAQTFLDS